MSVTILFAAVISAAATVLMTYGAWSLVTAERQRVNWRVRRTGIGFVPTTGPGSASLQLQDRARAFLQPVDRALFSSSWAERSRLQLQKASINLRLSEFIAIRVIATAFVAGSALYLAISNDQLLIGAFGIVAAAVVWWQIGSIVRYRIQHRQSAIERHLDDALQNISGSLRAGFSFTQACQLAIPQLPWPLNEELGDMIEEVNIGGSLDAALSNLARRVETYEMDITVNAVLVQRQVGGSLADILDSLTKTIRERRELRGHIMALTAQQRLSGYFVAAVPLFMLCLLSLTSWHFMKPLFVTFIGNILLVAAVLMDLLGFLLMRRLTRIDY